MAGETSAIRRDISQTREEIDAHLQELGGRVESTLDIQGRARQNLPRVLTGAAVAGLALGILVGRGRHREERLLSEEEIRLARQRGHLRGALEQAELERQSYDIP